MEFSVDVRVTTGTRREDAMETMRDLCWETSRIQKANPGLWILTTTFDDCESFDFTFHFEEAGDHDEAREMALKSAHAAVRGIGLPVIIREIG
jgi:hypothetical protein